MTEAERRERLQAVAQIIDDFVDDDHGFCLVVFSKEPPTDGERAVFDVIANTASREYVALVLQHVIEGIDESLLQPAEAKRPN